MGKSQEGQRRARVINKPYRNHGKKIPEKAPLVIRLLVLEMNKQQVTYEEMSRRTGVSRQAIKSWGRRVVPNFANLEACFNVLGYSLVPKELEE